jgi:hypothetical protein
LAEYGGAEQTQYRSAWDPENAGRYAALLTVTSLDGDQRKILLDTGWSNAVQLPGDEKATGWFRILVRRKSE